MTERLKVGSEWMHPCPGWSGNKFRCGKGNPRLIRDEQEVCATCEKAMEKAGETSRTKARETIQREILDRIHVNNLVWHARLAGAEDRVGQSVRLSLALEVVSTLMGWQRGLREKGRPEDHPWNTAGYQYWQTSDPASREDHFRVLVALGGQDPFVMPWRGRHRYYEVEHSAEAVKAQPIDGREFTEPTVAKAWDWPPDEDADAMARLGAGTPDGEGQDTLSSRSR